MASKNLDGQCRIREAEPCQTLTPQVQRRAEIYFSNLEHPIYAISFVTALMWPFPLGFFTDRADKYSWNQCQVPAG